MKNITDIIHIGELIAVSSVFKLNSFRMLSLLEKGDMEIFESKEGFVEKYGTKDTYPEIDWCELNNGKIFTKLK